MIFRYVTILLASAFFWQPGLAQDARIDDLKFENYIPRNGLPSDLIETIIQDKYGFIWLGTHNGILRFDGTEFKTFPHLDTDSNSLPDNDSRNIASDNTGKVWIATRKGLFYYDYSRNDFVRISSLAVGKPINWASSPVMGAKRCLWFYSNNGICHIDCKTLIVVPEPTPGMNRPAYSTHKLFSTASGNTWYFSDSALYFFDTVSGIFQKQLIPNNDKMLFRDGIQGLFEEKGGNLWIASFYGLYCYKRDDHTIERIPFSFGGKRDDHVAIQAFHFCKPLTGDSILWCSTWYEGLVLFNLHTKKFIRSFRQDNYDASSLGGSFCYTSFVDRDGIVWISHMNGLSKMDWHDQQIKSYRIREMVDSNRMMPVRKIIPDKRSPSNYWIVTWNYGVLYYNKDENRIVRRYQRPDARTSGKILFNNDAMYDDDGILWVASEIGLSHYDPGTDRFLRNKQLLPLAAGDSVIFRILKDNHRRLWLGTNAGLWTFNIHEKTFSKIHVKHPLDSSLVNSPVYAIHFDRHGRLYVGTHRGLYVLDTLSGDITPMIRDAGANKTDFNINYIWGIDIGKKGEVWVATRGGGLYKFDPLERIYTDYKLGNGLATEELRDVFVDSLENIWISSFDGIFKLDHGSDKFERFTPQDGLDNYNISLGRWTILNNKIYSGSLGAYSIIDPYARMCLTNRFPVWITGITVLDRAVHFNPDSSEKMIVPVDYTENNINFEFTALDYTSPAKTQYAYQLEGFDKGWHFCQNQRLANYNNLSGGSYYFKVRAMNAEGRWSGNIASVHIYIKPAYWETWWFGLLVVMMFGLLIYFLVRRRIKAIRQAAGYSQQQAVFHQKLAETEMVALRTQMNPHFIFNCMSIIDGLITDNRKEEAQDFLQKFSKLIRLVLENSQYQLVPLHQDIEALRLYVELEAVRYSNNFSCVFEIDPELLENNYKIPPLLLQPYVENAIVHGLRHKESGEGKLSIRVMRQLNKVSIIVTDNGIGRAKGIRHNEENRRPHQPIGMKVTAKRIDLLKMINLNNVSIQIADLNSGEEPGTTVTITLPLDFSLT
jgi:ligand-binding sensor domain-containing protein